MTQIQLPLDVKREPVFHGKTFERTLDQERLTGLLGRVHEFIKRGGWYNLRQISLFCKGTEASCSARLRDLRAKGMTIEKRRKKPAEKGIWEYRLKL